MRNYNDLCALFEDANRCLIKNDLDLFESEASERTLCVH